MRRLSVFAMMLMAMVMLLASCEESGPTTLKANKVTIDGQLSKDVFVVDGKYPLTIEQEEDEASSTKFNITINFSLVNPMDNCTCDPKVELMDGNTVLATMQFGSDAGDVEVKKKFGVYVVGHAQREFEAPFYYNSDDPMEVESIKKNVKSFRVVNMFKK